MVMGVWIRGRARLLACFGCSFGQCEEPRGQRRDPWVSENAARERRWPRLTAFGYHEMHRMGHGLQSRRAMALSVPLGPWAVPRGPGHAPRASQAPRPAAGSVTRVALAAAGARLIRGVFHRFPWVLSAFWSF